MLRYNCNEMSTASGVKCHFVLCPNVLCILLTSPLKPLSCCLLKKNVSKMERLDIMSLFFFVVDQMTDMETCNPTE